MPLNDLFVYLFRIADMLVVSCVFLHTHTSLQSLIIQVLDNL